jgi:CheY-like chemotaxis protein
MERILVVGSNLADREIRALMIEFGGYRCVTVGSLEEAVNLLQKDIFDLVVTELNLNGSGPEETVRRLKRVSPEMAVIALATDGEIATSADEVVRIPCPPGELARRIQPMLGKLIGMRARSRREKRRFPRYAVNLPCVIRDLRPLNTLKVEATTINISRGGVYVLTTGDWKVGSRLECVIWLPHHVFSGIGSGLHSEGKVVRVVPQENATVGLGIAIERFEFIEAPKA